MLLGFVDFHFLSILFQEIFHVFLWVGSCDGPPIVLGVILHILLKAMAL